MFPHLNTPRQLLGAACALALISPLAQAAPAGTWGVRLRATYLETVDNSKAFTALGVNFPADAVSVENKLIPEIDIDYWFSPNFSAELVLTIPQEHNVFLAGVGKLGSFKHLPPTLLAQYHFLSDLSESNFRPYVGAGVNLTLISDVKLSVAGTRLNLENSSIGLAGQVGFDYDLGGGRFINVDLKRAVLRTDVRAGGATLTTAKLDPWLFSVGFGWRF